MRLNLILPQIKPTEYEKPKRCANAECKGNRFHPIQEVKKSIRDTKYEEVIARRYQCKQCGRTFRVYPTGVSAKQISKRVNGIATMLYMLGLSYGATAIMLEALGVAIGKTSVYRAVQAAAERVPGMKQHQGREGYQIKALGADLTSVRCDGKWLTVGILVDASNGMTVCIEGLDSGEAEDLKDWLEPIMDAYDTDVLVTDDADAFKQVADKTGRTHQVCKSHVVRNTDELVAELSDLIREDKDHSLDDINVDPEQALADLVALKEMVHTRQPEDQVELEKLYDRYAQARKPRKGKYTIAYRMRNLFLDRWNLWPRLTFYRTWKDENGRQILDGTNNGCERSIGWWVKERYRTMRGYKRVQSALNISGLLAHAGNHLRGGLNLADLIA